MFFYTLCDTGHTVNTRRFRHPRTRWQAVLGSPRDGSWPPYRQSRKITGMVRSPLEGSAITLLRLAEPTEDSDYVRPICIDAEQPEEDDVTDCFTTGWDSEGQCRLRRPNHRYCAGGCYSWIGRRMEHRGHAGG